MVEGAALEILREAVRFVHQKPCNHAGFTRFEKLNILLFFPSVLSKALFHRKKAGKNGGLTYTETYRSGHNENDSKSCGELSVSSIKSLVTMRVLPGSKIE